MLCGKQSELGLSNVLGDVSHIPEEGPLSVDPLEEETDLSLLVFLDHLGQSVVKY